MKFASTSLLLTIAFLAATIPARADYFTVREVETRCRNQGRNAGRGAGIGIVAGCGIGLLLSRGRGSACAKGAVVGGVTGGLLGLAASCEDEVRYVTYWDDSLERRRVSQHYERWGNGCEGRIVREGYHRDRGYFCREYETIIRTRDGETHRRTVACQENGYWRHGYESVVIETRYQPRGRSEYRDRGERRSYLNSEPDYLDDENPGFAPAR